MSLITCPECHGQVSDKAAACPHCGYPLDLERKEKQKQLVYVLAQELAMQENNAASPEPDANSLFVPCQHCGKMTNRYKFLCENCGEKWSGTDYGKPDTSGDSPYTVRCRHCGQPTNKYKAACENCGKPIVQPTTGAKKASQDSGGHHVNGVLFVLVAAVIVVLIFWAAKPWNAETKKPSSGSSTASSSGSTYSGKSYSGSSGTTSKKYDDDEIKATVYVLAKKCVKNHLKAPSTAEFSEMWECAFTKGEDNVYMMTGYVDSQNSYGAMLQEQWSIMAQVSGDKASLVMLTIGDQVYFD